MDENFAFCTQPFTCTLVKFQLNLYKKGIPMWYCVQSVVNVTVYEY